MEDAPAPSALGLAGGKGAGWFGPSSQWGTNSSSPRTPDTQRETSALQHQCWHLPQGDYPAKGLPCPGHRAAWHPACPCAPPQGHTPFHKATTTLHIQQRLLSFGPPALCFLLPTSRPKGSSRESSAGVCRSQVLPIAWLCSDGMLCELQNLEQPENSRSASSSISPCLSSSSPAPAWAPLPTGEARAQQEPRAAPLRGGQQDPAGSRYPGAVPLHAAFRCPCVSAGVLAPSCTSRRWDHFWHGEHPAPAAPLHAAVTKLHCGWTQLRVQHSCRQRESTAANLRHRSPDGKTSP